MNADIIQGVTKGKKRQLVKSGFGETKSGTNKNGILLELESLTSNLPQAKAAK
jgi:hypothetical protein